MSFTAAELAATLRRLVPELRMTYKPDLRQAIVDFPQSIDNSAARADWSSGPRYDLESMARDMLAKIPVEVAAA